MRTTCLYLDDIVVLITSSRINFTLQIPHHTAESDSAETLLGALTMKILAKICSFGIS